MKFLIFAPIVALLALATPTLAFAHTAAYNQGYNGGSCSGFTGKDYDHCITGQNDAANGANSGSSSSSSSNHWQIGHDDACKSGHIAPGSHTQDYMNGFNQGLKDCRGDSSSGANDGGPVLNGTEVGVEPVHCDRPGYQSCYDLGWQAGSNHIGTTCPSGDSSSYCKGYNDASSGCARTYYGADCSKTYHNPLYDSSAYNLGYNDGKNAADIDSKICGFKIHGDYTSGPHDKPSGPHTSDYITGYKTGYSDEMATMDINCPQQGVINSG